MSLDVVNGEVEFKAMGPEEGRQSTGRGVSPSVFQYLEIQVLQNKEQEKKTEEASSEWRGRTKRQRVLETSRRGHFKKRKWPEWSNCCWREGKGSLWGDSLNLATGRSLRTLAKAVLVEWWGQKPNWGCLGKGRRGNRSGACNEKINYQGEILAMLCQKSSVWLMGEKLFLLPPAETCLSGH